MRWWATGDLIETQKGEWYMVLLGIRPYQKYIEDYNQYLAEKVDPGTRPQQGCTSLIWAGEVWHDSYGLGLR